MSRRKQFIIYNNKLIYKMQQVISLILIFFFVILLIFAILLLGHNYVCDGQTCKPFDDAKPLGAKDKVIFLTNALWDDGIWPFAYIASAISTGLIFALVPTPLTVRFFAIVFLLNFIVQYSIIAFFIHHYVRPIKQHIIDYINDIKR